MKLKTVGRREHLGLSSDLFTKNLPNWQIDVMLWKTYTFKPIFLQARGIRRYLREPQMRFHGSPLSNENTHGALTNNSQNYISLPPSNKQTHLAVRGCTSITISRFRGGGSLKWYLYDNMGGGNSYIKVKYLTDLGVIFGICREGG